MSPATPQVVIDSTPSLVPSTPTRVDSNLSATISAALAGASLPVGYHNVSLLVAGQWATVPQTDPGALLVGCATNYYGFPSETCLPCPAGAFCDGFSHFTPTPAWVAAYATALPAAPAYALYNGPSFSGPAGTNVDPRGNGVHTYPRPLPGFYSLNGTMAPLCPSPSARLTCIVACLPAAACTGDNHCAEGYASTPPMYRCASCATGFYPASGTCIKCPDSPAALFIGFALIIVAGAAGGYALNAKGINIAYFSIALNFYQARRGERERERERE